MIPAALVLKAEALFASTLQRSDEPTTDQVQQAATAAVLAHGTDGCAALLAQAYGDRPEAAAERMRWALSTVRWAFEPAGAR